MFTGLVVDLGKVRKAKVRKGLLEMEIESRATAGSLSKGDSVAVNGVCLTVVDKGRKRFKVQAMAETLRLTTLGRLRAGDGVNLELPARVGDRLGGHLVQGHVDSTAEVLRIEDSAGMRSLWLAASDELLRYLVRKGSVAIDGVSLTVADVGKASFEVALIPHTLTVTTLGRIRVGDLVNIEVDLVAKYVERFVPSR
jgi:riboflavin synthase